MQVRRSVRAVENVLPVASASTPPRRYTQRQKPLLLASIVLFASPGVLFVVSPVAAAAPGCGGKVATIVGTSSADVLVGTNAADVIQAGRGADDVRGMGGDDLVCGGSGADLLYGGGGVDRLYGGFAADRLQDFAGPGRDRLRGGPGDDVIRSGQDSGHYRRFRTLLGGPGADLLISADSSQGDALRGGPDSDVLVSAGFVRGEAAHYPDKLHGEGGHDTLRSQRGGLTDFKLTGDGDVVRVRNDGDADPYATSVRLKYRHAPGPVVVDLLAGFGRLVGSTTQDTILGLGDSTPLDVVVYGTPGNDQIFGHDSLTLEMEILRGEGGDDEIRGRAGNDWLLGGGGDDLLDGGEGSDQGGGDGGRDTCISMEFAEFCEVTR